MKKDLVKNRTFFYILIRAWNSFRYFNKCVDSVLSQRYKNYKILFVDDASDYAGKQINYIKAKLKGHITVFNRERRFSLFNANQMLHRYASEEEGVVLNLDGDDWLIDDKVLEYLNNIYRQTDCLLTFGECLIWDGKKLVGPARNMLDQININYPEFVVRKKLYRKYPFLPLHPRSWKVWLFKKIKKKDFLRPDGTWLQFAEDQAIFYPMLEMIGGRFKVIKKPLSVYNKETDLSDSRANLRGLIQDELIIRKKKTYQDIDL